MANATLITEADILEQVVNPAVADLKPEAARTLLKLRFNSAATKRIRQMLEKNNRGTISEAERLTLEKYLRVGQFLDLLHAKAKLSLKNNGESR
jgi:hypothetical protein